MKILKSRVLAAIVALLLVIFSVFFGGYRSLMRERARVHALYTTGDRYNAGLGRLIEARKNDANLLIVYITPLIKAGDEYFLEFSTLKQEFDRAKTYSELFSANAKLNESAYRLRGRAAALLKTVEKEEYDATYNHFIALSEEIDHHIYNAEAAGFNALLDEFPATALAFLIPIEPLEFFADDGA